MQQVNPEEKWFEFMKWLRLHEKGTYYRGVSDKVHHLLVPSIGRIEGYDLQQEIDLFEHFKLRVSLTSQKSLTDLEWLVLAQHHGLPTRLLDWTTNPLVATFFGVLSGENSEARIYAIKDDEYGMENLSLNISPFSIKKVKFIVPPVSSRRIELQRGLFSIHPFPEHPVVIYKYEHNMKLQELQDESITGAGAQDAKTQNVQSDLSRFNAQEQFYGNYSSSILFDIPASCKLFFEESIRSFGIDETIFGDVDSISKQLKYQFIKRQLRIISTPNLSYAYATWEKTLARSAVDYFASNKQKWTDSVPAVTCLDSISFDIDSSEEIDFNHKIVFGRFHFRIIPNLNDSSELFLKTEIAFSPLVRSINNVLVSVFDLHASILWEHGNSGRFKAKVFFMGQYADVEVQEIEIIDYDLAQHKKISDDVDSREKLFNVILSLFSDDELHFIETADSSDAVLKDLVERKIGFMKKQLSLL